MLPPAPTKSKPAEGGIRRLTQLLTDKGQDVIMQEDGTSRTRDELLTERIWDSALGMVEVGKDEAGVMMYAKPDMKMALAILERREGKTPAAVPDHSGQMTIADRIDDLAGVNAEADAISAVSEHSEDLDVSEDGDEDTEDS